NQNNKEFFVELFKLCKLTLQMRNSISNSTKSDDDYLISPVMNHMGKFYDSRNALDCLPKNGDANGGYHIAKKGLCVLDKINNSDDLSKVNLFVSNKEWLNYVQNNPL